MRREGGVIDINRVEERIKWVGARSMKRAIEIVCVCKSKYRATDLATGTSEGTGQVCVWQGDMTRALDVCVWEGRGEG